MAEKASGDELSPDQFSPDQSSAEDPTTRYPAPGSGEKEVEHPGLTGEMDVRPDHGERTYRGLGRLAGRKAVITGGDSGIGRAVALAFAREGADVLISYLPEEEDAQETVRLVEDAGRVALTVPGDLAKRRPAGRSSSGPSTSSARSTYWSATPRTRWPRPAGWRRSPRSSSTG